MDDNTPSHGVDVFILDSHMSSTTLALPPPDPETRGRKRRRDPFSDFALARPLRDSSTLRGRGRHRSPMWMHLLPPRCGSSAARLTSTNSRQRAGAGKAVAAATSYEDSPSSASVDSYTNLCVLGVVIVRPDGQIQSQQQALQQQQQQQQRRRRNQSPSRSQSPRQEWSKTTATAAAAAAVLSLGRRTRRHRTISRSRRHELGDAFAVVGGVGAEVTVAAAVRGEGRLV